MKRTAIAVAASIAALSSWVVPARAESGGQSAGEIMERYRMAEHHAGTDRKTLMHMETVSKEGKKRVREFMEIRWSGDATGQKWFFYYMFQPEDVKGLTVMVAAYPDKRDDRWGYLPKLDLVRKFEAVDELQTFLGSELTYEDSSGRDRGLDEEKVLREEKIGDMDCYVIESVPRGHTVFSKRVFWIDKKTFLSPRFEYYDLSGHLWKRIESKDLEIVTTSAGNRYPTFRTRTVTNERTGSRSDVRFVSVEYDIGVDVNAFARDTLRAPPAAWISR